MKFGDPIYFQVVEKHIEYKIGDGQWVRYSKVPYFNEGIAWAAMLQLKEETKHGLNESVKVLLGLEDLSNHND